MIDGQEVQRHIDTGRSFRIGARGICVDCIYDRGIWTIKIPRGFIEFDVDDISVLDDPDFFDLTFSMDKGMSYQSLIDLREYDKLTVII